MCCFSMKQYSNFSLYGKDFYVCFLDFTCAVKMNLTMLLDTSSTVTDEAWKNIKDFQKKLTRRMPLEVVKTSLVSFNENVKLMLSSSDFENAKNFESAINQLETTNGSERMDLAFDFTEKLTDAIGNSEKKAIVFITNKQLPHGLITKLEHSAENIKQNGGEIFMLVIRQEGNNLLPFKRLASEPIRKHLFSISNHRELSKWADVVARAFC